MEKTALGDGVYVDFDGFALVLTTEDGTGVTNRIVLDPPVYEEFARYVEELVGERVGESEKPRA